MQNLDWSFFEGWDDEILIPLNLTAREMAVLRTAISFIEDVDVWDDSFDYYNDVVPITEIISFIIADDV